MSDEPAAQEAVEPQKADRPHESIIPSHVAADEPVHGHGSANNSMAYVQMAIAFTAGNFASAFLQALGKRAGDSAANVPRRVRDLVRKRVTRKGQEEIHISAKGGTTTTVVITPSTPDEARLALLDLDVTAPELRGREMRWDEIAGEWRPSDAPPPKPGDATDD